ncbi:MAG: patatin-like phospholipase family protein [Hyphomicrobiaceae bacterium]|nr:patatin-like phospholipase family protein [Hyphomicrobiaceae bacterium]
MTAEVRPTDVTPSTSPQGEGRERLLEGLEIFEGLSPEQRTSLAAELSAIPVRRGEVLVRQGDAAHSMFIVVSGRFSVSLEGRPNAICEIGPGQPIGEIAFLSGGCRTATVTALRDGLVLRLERADFDSLVARSPALWRVVTTALARRLAEFNVARPAPPDPRPRTIAVVRAGMAPVPLPFVVALAETLSRASQPRKVRGRRVQVIDHARARGLLPPGSSFDSPAATAAFNDLERQSDFVVYLANDDLDSWSDKAIRQADIVLEVGMHAGDPRLSPLELRAAELMPTGSRRLVLLHPTRHTITGTRRWLAGRSVAMHHHVALDTAGDLARLARFIKGTAIGLIACGGGALCTAQVGLYQALDEAGVTFDMMGGTSGGSAMTAAFALGRTPREVDAAVHHMFVTRRAMRRLTWPRYSLIDHKRFDEQLATYYGGDIEDLWLPFFAVSTNLSRYNLSCHRTGSLWSAVRASSSIPVLLPPYYTSEGDMLVDGCLLDNVPIKAMHELKSGPNVVMSFAVPDLERFDVSYDAIPSRGDLIARSVNPFARKSLPDAPGLMTVLMRSLMANRQDFKRHLTDEDLLMVPPVPDDMSFLDWHRHSELVELSCDWARRELQRDGSAMRSWLDDVMLDRTRNAVTAVDG